MKKISSILDYSYPFLDPAVWTDEQNLFPYQKDFLMRLINKIYETYDLKQTETWVKDIVIIGSLTTSKWLFTSDLDVHIRIDLEAFKASNMPQATIEQAFSLLDETRKKFDRAKILAPMTQHPIEFYFESVSTNPSNITDVGVYSIIQDAWLKAPVLLPADLDFEESKRDVIAQAEALAQGLDVSFGKIQREIQRIDELEDIVKAWGRDKQQLFYAKVEQKLSEIEAEITKDLKIKQDLVDARHAGQDATSDIEVKFKWLARFGFFSILSNLKTLLEQTGGQITTCELPLIDKIISEGSIKEAAKAESYWVDPKGTIFTCDYDHGSWVLDNQKMLSDNYNLNLELDSSNLDGLDEESDEYLDASETGAADAVLKLISNGWTRVFRGDELGIQINDLTNPSSYMEGPFIQFASDSRGGIVVSDLNQKSVSVDPEYGFIKGIQKGLQSQRMGSIKEAFLKEAFEKETETDICVDLDKTIAKEAEFPKIGEPIEGAKEGLHKLKDMGYNVIIYSCRADDSDGLEQVREYLDKHDLPYDSIFEGEKPFAKFYIDDHAIRFDNWDNVLKQVEKSEKKASLHITAGNWPDAAWIAPDGQMYDAKPTHDTWMSANVDMLKQKYNFDMSRWIDTDDMYDAVYALIKTGWSRLSIAPNHQDYMVEVASLRAVPQAVFDTLINSPASNFYIEETNGSANIQLSKDELMEGQKGVNKALQHQRMSSSLFSKKDITAQTKKVKQGNFSCVMALVPHELAQEIVAWGIRNVPDEDVYLDGDKFGRELESHVTIKYGLLTDNGKHVRRSFNNSKPFKAKLGKVRHFQPPELPFDVLTIEVISEDLTKANEMICDKFDCEEGLVSDEYKPHITIAYMKRGDAKEYVGADDFEGREVVLDTVIFSPNKGNRTYFSVGTDKESSLILEKTADFLPSLFNAPDNDWQFAEGGPDKEIALNPDSVSDDTTEYEPCTTGKPRTKEVWRQFISMFSNLFSKNDTRKIESYDKELEEAEKNSLGEDQTLLEYSKGFEDLNLKHNPHNTTWDSLTQDGEPSKPTSVTYSPQISNEDNLDQNSPGGYPRRFMGKPKGEWTSNEGEVNNALIDMLKNREAALDSMTIDIEADLSNAYWIDPDGNQFQVRGSNFGNSYGRHDTHDGWIQDNLEMLNKDYGIEPRKDQWGSHLDSRDLISYGWIRIGDSHGKDWGVSVKDLSNIPQSVDNLLAQFAPEGSKIEIDDSHNQYEVIDWPVKSLQQAVNRARMVHASLEKEAITRQYALYVGGRLAIRTLTRAKAIQTCKERFPKEYASNAYEIREEAFKVAGLQSASVPDYLCDEWKTEQINNDTDEEPYVNHDQRDYPYGMRDMNDSSTDYPKPEDITRSVVHLDTLEEPAYRLDPFGIGSYNVIWYNSLPLTDGIESMNDE